MSVGTHLASGRVRRGKHLLRTLATALVAVLTFGTLAASPAAGAQEPAPVPAEPSIVGGPANGCSRTGLGDDWNKTFDLELVGLPDDLEVTKVVWSTRSNHSDEYRELGTSVEPPYRITWTPFPDAESAGESSLQAAVYAVLPRFGEVAARREFLCYMGGPEVPVTLGFSSQQGEHLGRPSASPDGACYASVDVGLDYAAVGLTGPGRPGIRELVLRRDGVPLPTDSLDWNAPSGTFRMGCDGKPLSLGEHTFTASVETWSGHHATATATMDVVPPVDLRAPVISTTNGQKVTSSTWVLSGSRLRYSTMLSTEMSAGDIETFQVEALDGNLNETIASGSSSDGTMRSCRVGPQGGCVAVGVTAPIRARYYDSSTYTVRTSVWASGWGPSDMVQRRSAFKIYPRGALSTPSSSTLTKGASRTLSVRLTSVAEFYDAPTRAIAGQKLVFQTRAKGASTWRNVRTLTTDSRGEARTVAKPSVAAQYRFVHADAPGAVGPATSGVVTINVR